MKQEAPVTARGRLLRYADIYPAGGIHHWLMGIRFLILLIGALLAHIATAQPSSGSLTLPHDRFRNGEATLRAFASISEATRNSIIKLNVDGATVALGVVVDTNGLALTKASEIKKGKLTCWLATDKEVPAQLLSTDEDEDLALVRVEARGLKPIQWATNEVTIGQWAITPGVTTTPHAVGIVSALPRKIRPQRAFIGVQFDFGTSLPKVEAVLPGLGAEMAGIQPGDVLLSLNETEVTNREQVVEIVRDLRDGQTVKLRVQRDDEEFDADVKLMVPTPEQLGFSRPRSSRLTGEVSQRAEGFEQAIEHDTVLPPWLCGGPLVNLEGKAIGLNIARAGRVTTYALPARLVQRIFTELKAKVRTS
jgi:serine protease Do